MSVVSRSPEAPPTADSTRSDAEMTAAATLSPRELGAGFRTALYDLTILGRSTEAAKLAVGASALFYPAVGPDADEKNRARLNLTQLLAGRALGG